MDEDEANLQRWLPFVLVPFLMRHLLTRFHVHVEDCYSKGNSVSPRGEVVVRRLSWTQSSNQQLELQESKWQSSFFRAPSLLLYFTVLDALHAEVPPQLRIETRKRRLFYKIRFLQDFLHLQESPSAFIIRNSSDWWMVAKMAPRKIMIRWVVAQGSLRWERGCVEHCLFICLVGVFILGSNFISDAFLRCVT